MSIYFMKKNCGLIISYQLEYNVSEIHLLIVESNIFLSRVCTVRISQLQITHIHMFKCFQFTRGLECYTIKQVFHLQC